MSGVHAVLANLQRTQILVDFVANETKHEVGGAAIAD
jgi:hypothetical protein